MSAQYSSSGDDAEALRLIRLAGRGDHEAFNTLARTYHRLTVNVAFRQLHNVEDAEDAAQNAWLYLWRSCRRYSFELPDGFLAVGLIINMAVRSARALHHRRMAKKRGEGNPGLYDGDVRRELLGLHEYSHHGARREVVEREPAADPLRKMGMVHRLTGQIPPVFLAKLDAFFFKGESVPDMAQRFGCSQNDVKRSLGTGIQLMRHLAGKDPENAELAA
jgi:RNA polymerase sigma factor (sigma-70 family)